MFNSGCEMSQCFGTLGLKDLTDFSHCNIDDFSKQNWSKVFDHAFERIQWVRLSNLCENRLDNFVPDAAGEVCLMLRAEETWSKTAFVTPTDSWLSFFEGIFKRGRGGSAQKPCRTLGTTLIITSCGLNVLDWRASCRLCLRILV